MRQSWWGEKKMMKKPKIENVKKGMVFRVRSQRYGVTNYARVTRGDYSGLNRKIFYAIFVKPKNFSKKRLPSDGEFAVWDFDYTFAGKLADVWSRVK